MRLMTGRLKDSYYNNSERLLQLYPPLVLSADF